MPRSIKRPQTGAPVWYYANPAPAAPQAAVVCQTISWSDATETGVFNLFVLSGVAVGSAQLNVNYSNSGANPQIVTAAAIAAGGANYNVGDQVTLSNGVVLQVSTVTTGAITAVTVVNGGSSVTASPPANPVAQVSTTGTGTGATFNLTWSSGAWCTYPRAFESTASLQPAGADAGMAPPPPPASPPPPNPTSANPGEEDDDPPEPPPSVTRSRTTTTTRQTHR